MQSARVGGLLALLVLATACESNKSANPLSPSVAGPIPGVEISAPKPLEPGVNWEVSNDKQPLALLIENPGTNGQRPVTLEVEVASDEGFSTKVFTKAGVEPGPNGRTQLQLPSKLASDRTYFWRAKGQDGANQGPWSPTVRFSILHAGGAAGADASVPGRRRDGRRPRSDLQVQERRRARAASAAITYLVDIARNDSFTSGVATYTGGEEGGAGGETTVEPASACRRARRSTGASARGTARSTARGRARSSSRRRRRLPVAAAVVVAAVVVARTGGGGGGNPGNCASRDGEYIVELHRGEVRVAIGVRWATSISARRT